MKWILSLLTVCSLVASSNSFAFLGIVAPEVPAINQMQKMLPSLLVTGFALTRSISNLPNSIQHPGKPPFWGDYDDQEQYEADFEAWNAQYEFWYNIIGYRLPQPGGNLKAWINFIGPCQEVSRISYPATPNGCVCNSDDESLETQKANNVILNQVMAYQSEHSGGLLNRVINFKNLNDDVESSFTEVYIRQLRTHILTELKRNQKKLTTAEGEMAWDFVRMHGGKSLEHGWRGAIKNRLGETIERLNIEELADRLVNRYGFEASTSRPLIFRSCYSKGIAQMLANIIRRPVIATGAQGITHPELFLKRAVVYRPN